MTPTKDRTAPVTFRDSRLEMELAERQMEGESLGIVAKRELARYYAILETGQNGIDNRFTLREVRFMLKACKETQWGNTEKNIRYLHFEIRDAYENFREIEDLTFEYVWHFRGADLLAKVKALPNDQAWALIDFIERYWKSPINLNADDAARDLATDFYLLVADEPAEDSGPGQAAGDQRDYNARWMDLDTDAYDIFGELPF